LINYGKCKDVSGSGGIDPRDFNIATHRRRITSSMFYLLYLRNGSTWILHRCVGRRLGKKGHREEQKHFLTLLGIEFRLFCNTNGRLVTILTELTRGMKSRKEAFGAHAHYGLENSFCTHFGSSVRWLIATWAGGDFRELMGKHRRGIFCWSPVSLKSADTSGFIPLEDRVRQSADTVSILTYLSSEVRRLAVREPCSNQADHSAESVNIARKWNVKHINVSCDHYTTIWTRRDTLSVPSQRASVASYC
jgi:hypothetical protein